ncbi:MAG: DUF1499 domain-containing protein [Anaerolineales bacterium]|nr:DUF1499 domain-containing protein [Anaerolineales bacterium]
MPKILMWLLVLLVGGLVVFLLLRWLVERVSPAPDNLGVENGRLAPCPDTPNCVSTFAADTEHGMDPIPYNGDREAAHAAILTILQSRPRVTILTNDPTYIRAEFRSATWRFIDDVEFYFDDAEGLIHFRSASRLGEGDMGVNRQRMEEIRESYENR